jgi:SpoVK/Ycf46/Vps4 family AAA+-type ATPase
LPAEVTAVTTPGPGITGTTVKELAKKAHGMTAADLLLVVKEAHLICLERHLAKHEGKETTEASLIAAMDSLSLQSNTAAATPAVPESFVAIPAVLESTAFTVSKSLLVPTREDLLKALGRVPPSALREVVVEVPTVYWGDIGGMDGVKQSLREVIVGVGFNSFFASVFMYLTYLVSSFR